MILHHVYWHAIFHISVSSNVERNVDYIKMLTWQMFCMLLYALEQKPVNKQFSCLQLQTSLFSSVMHPWNVGKYRNSHYKNSVRKMRYNLRGLSLSLSHTHTLLHSHSNWEKQSNVSSILVSVYILAKVKEQQIGAKTRMWKFRFGWR